MRTPLILSSLAVTAVFVALLGHAMAAAVTGWGLGMTNGGSVTLPGCAGGEQFCNDFSAGLNPATPYPAWIFPESSVTSDPFNAPGNEGFHLAANNVLLPSFTDTNGVTKTHVMAQQSTLNYTDAGTNANGTAIGPVGFSDWSPTANGVAAGSFVFSQALVQFNPGNSGFDTPLSVNNAAAFTPNLVGPGGVLDFDMVWPLTQYSSDAFVVLYGQCTLRTLNGNPWSIWATSWDAGGQEPNCGFESNNDFEIDLAPNAMILWTVSDAGVGPVTMTDTALSDYQIWHNYVLQWISGTSLCYQLDGVIGNVCAFSGAGYDAGGSTHCCIEASGGALIPTARGIVYLQIAEITANPNPDGGGLPNIGYFDRVAFCADASTVKDGGAALGCP